MRARVLLLAAVLIAACDFSPTGLRNDSDGAVTDGAVADGEDDPDAADPDASPIDARIDARVIDARIDAPIDAPAPRCPTGYGPLGTAGGSYRVVESPTLSWTEAAADCDNDDESGGFTGFTHLVVIGDDAEKAALTVPPAFSGNTWVGLSDRAAEGVYLWVTAEPVAGYPVLGQHPPWEPGEPDGGAADDCIRFKNSFDFEDKDCAGANSYVCECDAFPPL